MILSLTAILLCQLLGEAMARTLDLPIPGPVIGMALLFVFLLIRDRLRAPPAEPGPEGIEPVAKRILAHLSLLFVPAGVGVMQSLDVLGTYGVALATALIVSTVAALIVAVYVFTFVARRLGQDEAAP